MHPARRSILVFTRIIKAQGGAKWITLVLACGEAGAICQLSIPETAAPRSAGVSTARLGYELRDTSERS